MAKEDVWPAIHSERRALAADLEPFDEAKWSARSLCDEWTVREVLAHMTATAKLSAPAFFGKMIGSGFSLQRMQAKDVETEKGDSPQETFARFKAEVESTKHPPGPVESWLGETIVHSEDIRRPLGIKHEYPSTAVTRVADFYKGSNLILGTKNRIAGLKLKATDTDWSHGEGPEVSGPIVSLLLAMTGRRAAAADLTGEGVATLSSRP